MAPKNHMLSHIKLYWVLTIPRPLQWSHYWVPHLKAPLNVYTAQTRSLKITIVHKPLKQSCDSSKKHGHESEWRGEWQQSPWELPREGEPDSARGLQCPHPGPEVPAALPGRSGGGAAGRRRGPRRGPRAAGHRASAGRGARPHLGGGHVFWAEGWERIQMSRRPGEIATSHELLEFLFALVVNQESETRGNSTF